MSQESKILDLFDKYFENANKAEIQSDIKFINSLGSNGVSFEEYLETLNRVTSISLIETGLCDDIAYSDLFNKLISPIQMGDIEHVTIMTNSINIKCEDSNCSTDWAYDYDNFASAA